MATPVTRLISSGVTSGPLAKPHTPAVDDADAEPHGLGRVAAAEPAAAAADDLSVAHADRRARGCA